MTLPELAWSAAIVLAVVVFLFMLAILIHVCKRIYQRYKEQQAFISNWVAFLKNELTRKAQ